MNWWQAIILGAVQGFTEFLPVSSSGHLLLIQKWFGITENNLFYTIIMHLGTLIPVIVVLWKDILDKFKKPASKFWLWVLATIPAGIVGVLLSVVFDMDALFSEHIWLLAITFVITAGLLLFSEFRCKKVEMLNGITVKTSLIMGAGQAFGVLPGISRSGATLTAGCIAKVERKENASFTFIMSIPIIVAALAMEVFDMATGGGFAGVEVLPVVIGFLTSMVTGYIAIRFMLKIIQKANYKWFSLYLVLMSIATVITAVV